MSDDTALLDEERLSRLAQQIGAAALARMLDQLGTRLGEADAALKSQISLKDASAIVKEAHKLAGVAASFGADRVAAHARALEQHVLASGTTGLEQAAELLYAAIAETGISLKARTSA